MNVSADAPLSVNVNVNEHADVREHAQRFAAHRRELTAAHDRLAALEREMFGLDDTTARVLSRVLNPQTVAAERTSLARELDDARVQVARLENAREEFEREGRIVREQARRDLRRQADQRVRELLTEVMTHADAIARLTGELSLVKDPARPPRVPYAFVGLIESFRREARTFGVQI